MIFERKTIVSEKVLELLKQHSAPIAISQLATLLKNAGLSPNKTTLYRIMEKLKSKQIVQETVIQNGVSYFELATKPHHHHFFCTDCEDVYCLDSCALHSADIDLTQLLPNPNFSLSHHEFNLYGTCDICLNPPKPIGART